MSKAVGRLLWIGVVAAVFSACRAQSPQQVSLCGPTGQLRVGFVGADEGRARGGQAVLSDQEIGRLRDRLTVASQCEVQLEPCSLYTSDAADDLTRVVARMSPSSQSNNAALVDGSER